MSILHAYLIYDINVVAILEFLKLRMAFDYDNSERSKHLNNVDSKQSKCLISFKTK